MQVGMASCPNGAGSSGTGDKPSARGGSAAHSRLGRQHRVSVSHSAIREGRQLEHRRGAKAANRARNKRQENAEKERREEANGSAGRRSNRNGNTGKASSNKSNSKIPMKQKMFGRDLVSARWPTRQVRLNNQRHWG